MQMLARNWRSWFFRTVAVCAIIFAAGHSGGFLNRQEGALAAFQWGMFGAVVAGMALWGGMYIFSAHGDRWGLVIALVAALADCFMAYGWFVSAGATVSPILLATWPPLLAVLAGVIEGRMARQVEQAQSAEAEKDAEAKRKLEARLATMKLKAELAATIAPVQAPVIVVNPVRSAPERTNERTNNDQHAQWLDSWDGKGTVRDVAESLGVSVSTAHGALKDNHWHPIGRGVWSHNGDVHSS